MIENSGHWRIQACLPCVAAALLLSGCSTSEDSLPRQPVDGTVLVDGRRLAYGTIIFYPQRRPTRNDGAVASGDMIVNGRFSIPRRKGPLPGMYKIAIFAERTRRERIEREASPGKAGPAAKEKIPARFNSDTELEVEIKEGGIKDLKIEIEST